MNHFEKFATLATVPTSKREHDAARRSAARYNWLRLRRLFRGLKIDAQPARFACRFAETSSETVKPVARYGLRLEPARRKRNRIPFTDASACRNGRTFAAVRPRWHGPETVCACENYRHDTAPSDVMIPILESWAMTKWIVDDKFIPFVHHAASEFYRTFRAIARKLASAYVVETDDVFNEWISRACGGHNPETDSALLARYRKENPRPRGPRLNRSKRETARRYRASQLNLAKRLRLREDELTIQALPNGRIGADDEWSMERCAANLSRRARVGVRIRVTPETSSATKSMLRSMGYDGELLREISRNRRETVRLYSSDRAGNVLENIPETETDTETQDVFKLAIPSALVKLSPSSRTVAEMLMEGKSRAKIQAETGINVSRAIDSIREQLTKIQTETGVNVSFTIDSIREQLRKSAKMEV